MLSLLLFQQATEYLQEHTSHIKTENQRLRKELQQLIDMTNDLQLQKKRLEKQYQTLLQEHQFNQDLKQLRGSVFRGRDSSPSSFDFSGTNYHASQNYSQQRHLKNGL